MSVPAENICFRTASNPKWVPKTLNHRLGGARLPTREPVSATNKRTRQLFAGAMAGAVTKTSVAPLERIKLLFQVQGMLGSTNTKYTSIWGAGRTVVQEEGLLALYKGNLANVVRVAPVHALKFTFNDTFRDVVRKPGQKDLSILQMMVAGSMAGLLQGSITFPLELVRARLALGEGMGAKYNGIYDCFRTTIRTEGPLALYKGLGPTLLTGPPYVALQMTAFTLAQRALPKSDDPSKQVVLKLAAGASAGLVAQTITYPGDTIRKRMMNNGMSGAERVYQNSWHCARTILAKEGVKGFFRGLSTNVVRCLPGSAIQFTTYDMLKGLMNAN